MNARDHIRVVEEAWFRMRAAVDLLGPEGLEATTPAGWTVKEMLAHIAFWDETSVPVIVGMMRGHDLPSDFAFGSGDLGLTEGDEWPRAAVHNAREAAWARGRTGAQVLDRWDAAHAWRLWAIASVTDAESATDTFWNYLSALPGHYMEHMAEIESVLHERG